MVELKNFDFPFASFFFNVKRKSGKHRGPYLSKEEIREEITTDDSINDYPSEMLNSCWKWARLKPVITLLAGLLLRAYLLQEFAP